MSEEKTVSESVAEVKQTVQSLYDEHKQVVDKIQDEVKNLGQESAETKEHFEKLNNRWDEMEAKWQRAASGVSEEQSQADELKTAFNQALVKGNKIDQKYKDILMEHKALVSDDLENGGLFSIPNFDQQLVEKLREISPVRQVARIKTINSGDSLTVRRRESDSTVNWVGERETNSNTGTPTFKQLRIQAHTLEARPQISREELEDADVAIETILQNDEMMELAQVEGAAFISGDGVGKPEGILTNSNIGSVDNGALTLDADKIIDLRYSLKEGYLNNASFMLNRLTVAEVRKLKAQDDNYLWQPGLSQLAPANILGAPYVMATDLASGTAGTYTDGDAAMLYGDFNRGYYILDRLGTELLIDPYTQKPFIEYYIRKRTGGQVVQPEAIAKLTMSS